MTRERYEPVREPTGEEPRSWLRSRHGIAFAVFGAGALYFLLTEHLAHTIQALPYLILLLCPLMHVFMHGGHGSHGGHGGGDERDDLDDSHGPHSHGGSR